MMALKLNLLKVVNVCGKICVTVAFLAHFHLLWWCVIIMKSWLVHQFLYTYRNKLKPSIRHAVDLRCMYMVRRKRVFFCWEVIYIATLIKQQTTPKDYMTPPLDGSSLIAPNWGRTNDSTHINTNIYIYLPARCNLWLRARTQKRRHTNTHRHRHTKV